MVVITEELRAEAKKRLIVALDVPGKREAFNFIRLLQDKAGAYKIGMQLYNSEGPQLVEYIGLFGGQVFVDLKFHDIPNTVAEAAKVMVDKGAFMCTLHASGGSKMLTAAAQAAREEAAQLNCRRPLLLGVTVLTSTSQQQFNEEMGLKGPICDRVVYLSQMAQKSGLDGVICSPQEITAIRKACGIDFLIVTPGVRPTWAGKDDQARVLTPREAIASGADYLVIGRPITKAADHADAAGRIIDEIALGLADREQEAR